MLHAYVIGAFRPDQLWQHVLPVCAILLHQMPCQDFIYRNFPSFMAAHECHQVACSFCTGRISQAGLQSQLGADRLQDPVLLTASSCVLLQSNILQETLSQVA